MPLRGVTEYQAAAGPAAARQHYIDWLRVLAVMAIFLYHSARFFDHAPWLISNDELSLGMSAFVTFVAQWSMPLFFFLSGAGTWFALGFRTTGHYVKERATRLIVPFVFGLAMIVPPQRHYEFLSNPEIQDPRHLFIPRFLEGEYPGWSLGWLEYGLNLWFLAYLFIFSLLALPLLNYLKKEQGRRLVSGLAALCERKGAILLFALPLVLIEVVLRPIWPGYLDWADFFFWITSFIYGYLFVSDARFGQAVARNGKAVLALGIVSSVAISAIYATVFVDTGAKPEPGYSAVYLSFRVLHAFSAWFWIVAALAVARRYLNSTNRVLQYANEGALPFYILHQTVIVAVGFYVVQWPASVLAKYLAISTISFVTIIAIYEFLVRRTRITRFLFGMKPRARARRV